MQIFRGLIILPVLAFVFAGCENSNEDSYSLRVLEKGNSKLISIHFERVPQADTAFLLTYSGNENIINRHFQLSRRESGLNYLISDNDTTKLIVKEKKYYTIANRDYNVYKLHGNADEADGLLVYFWCEEFGVLVSRIPTWGKSEILICNKNDERCETLATLQHLLMTDHFFCNDEIKSQIDFTEPKVENEVP